MLKPSRAKLLADLLPQALGPAAAKQGFAGAEIMARWATIVGPEIAARATPLKLAAPRPQGPDAPPGQSTLHLRVEGAFALEIQHRVPEIQERVNAHLGWACVGSVKLRQGSGPAARAPHRPPAPPPPATEAETARVRSATARVEEAELAAALDRLGMAALAKSRTRAR